MKRISYSRHRFPPEVIRYAVWLYFRFTMSFRDVGNLMAERGFEISYETIRRWTLKFGQSFARKLRRSRSRPTARWHLDEMVVKIGGQEMYLWRAVDDEGEVLDMLVQKRRNKTTVLRLLRELLKNQGVYPETIITDGLASYGAAIRELGCEDRHRPGRLRESNRAENSHLPIRRRERKQQRFRSQGSAQRFIATHAVIYNAFNVQRYLIRRPTLRQFRAEAMAMWAAATSAA